ncbi:MAG: glycosyl hydrolase [Flavobacteriales bacterium]|nr:glycosyl hydrolase [Bacteroidota bacterium]MCB9239747.1 glycosyl hydrolase [Flavobacteriales bacterium]
MRILTSVLTVCTIGLLTVQAQVDTSWFHNLSYRSIGPNRGGRCAAVCGSTLDRDLFYMGTTGGGVWKTSNGGHSWTNISDTYFGGSIGSVELAPSDENVIYVGQGEETLRGNVSSGEGVWRSVDAGKTWRFMGLKESRHIPRMAVHPKNADVVMAAVLGDLFTDSEMRGIYRSEDGGSSWKKVLDNGKKAGANDIVFDPFNHRNVFASTWEVRRSPYDFSSGGKGSALWRSRDEGKTWQNISKNPGLPEGLLGKITLAPSRAKKDLIYAMVEHASQGGLYRSDDGGDTWKLVNSSAEIRQRSWYFSRVTADPKDPETVYVMNVRFQKSTDGGKSFKPVYTPHVDHHQLWIDPQDAKRMIVANDGGGQVSYNGGGSWTSYHNQPTEQFYRVTTDNHVPYRIYGAQQDNSTMRVDHLTGQWESTAGGESATIAPDPLNPEIVYAGSYGGYLTRRNHRTGDNRGINVWPDNPLGYGAEGMKYRFQWNFPLFFSPHDSTRLYAASNHLHVSHDGGNSWKMISPDLTTNDPEKLKASGGPITKDNTGVEYYCTIFAVVESELEPGLIYTGSDDGLVYRTKDNGANWNAITPPKMPKGLMINQIECDPFEKGHVYVVATGYKMGDNHPYIYVSADYGDTWKLCTKGLPENHFTRTLRCDKSVRGLCYAGTERGMYISYNNGEQWQPFQLNLPIVPITDLCQRDDDLIVATQGRGFWMIDDLSAVRKAGKTMPDGSRIVNANGDFICHGSKAGLSFYLSDSIKPSDTFMVDVFSSDGKRVRSWAMKGSGQDTSAFKPQKGMNYLDWNLRYPKAYVPSGMILWAGRTGGPTAAPGIYKFRLTVGDRTFEKTFELKHNPMDEGSAQDAREKFAFQMEVITALDSAHRSLDAMATTSAQINDLLKKHSELSKTDSLQLLGKAIQSELDSLRNDIYQTKLRSEQDPINYPIKLNNKLAHVNMLVSMGTYGPTTQAVQLKNELLSELSARLDRYEAMKANEIRRFNQMLLDRRINYIVPK